MLIDILELINIKISFIMAEIYAINANERMGVRLFGKRELSEDLTLFIYFCTSPEYIHDNIIALFKYAILHIKRPISCFYMSFLTSLTKEQRS